MNEEAVRTATTWARCYNFGLFSVVRIKIIYPDRKADTTYYFHSKLRPLLRQGRRAVKLWVRGWRDDPTEEFGIFPKYLR